MTHRNTTSYLSILFSLFLLSHMTAFAAPQTYEDYQKDSQNYCDTLGGSSARSNTLIPKIEYPKFDTASVNNTMARWREDRRVPDDAERLRLRYDLDPVTIGEFSGFKTLEVARIGYRTHMNSLFACAVISSRFDSINGLQKVIGQKVKSKNSEILEKLKKEGNALSKKYSEIGCNTDKNVEIVTNLTNTIIVRYCDYRHYLNYLDSNIEDVSQVQSIEKGIGQGTGTQVSTNTEDWNAASLKYKSAVANEILRVDTTLPKALRTLIEMDQTYGAHILLMLIYDDYLRLRKALSAYMNLSSQLYQKANNAQGTIP